MHREPAPPRSRQPHPSVDLVIVGALTLDRFDDGSEAAGGSALHGALAAAAAGHALGIVTQAGVEPLVQTALEELARIAAWVHRTPGRTIRYIHRESGPARRLSLEQGGGRIRLGTWLKRRSFRSVLVAPVGDEIIDGDLSFLDSGQRRLGASLQGWLRSHRVGEVEQRRLSGLSPQLIDALRGFDLITASTEDLRLHGTDPAEQLKALRHRFGLGPALVLTSGEAGVWLSPTHAADSAPLHIPPPMVVRGVPTVGAGDMLAALLMASPWSAGSPKSFERHAAAAMRRVAEILEGRRTA
jgi:sugar/nucleoside kinase (ribokinase family)